MEKMNELDIKALKEEIKREYVKQKVPSELDDDEIDFSQYLKVIQRNLTTLLVFPILFAIVVGAAFWSEKSFASQATLFLHTQAGGGGGAGLSGLLLSGLGLGGGGLPMGGGGTNTSAYITAILKSKRMEEEVLKTLKIASDSKIFPKEWRKVEFNKDGLLALEVKTTDATKSMEIVNCYLEALDSQLKGPARKKRNYIEKQLSQVSEELVKTEGSLKEFQEKNQCLTVESKALPVYTKFYSLKQDLYEVGISLQITEKLLKILGRVPELIRTEIEKITQEAKQKAISEILPELEGKIGEMPGFALDFKRVERAWKVKEKLYLMLTEQFEMAKISAIEEESQFEIIDKAEVGQPAPGKNLQKVVAAGVIGFFLALFYVFIQEFRGKEEEEPEAKEKSKGA